MGGGSWDHSTYTSSRASRASKGVSDFHYSDTATQNTPVHPNLDPQRIKGKPFEKLESRDSKEHPESNAVFVSFDVTGSNYTRAVEAQKRLPNLMNLLRTYLTDPQVLIAANDDIEVEDRRSIQISDYESDNRIDEDIRNVLLTNNGGGNDGESYDLILLAAAQMTVLDCLDKRGRKGYFFMYADEPIRTHVEAAQVKRIFDIDAEGKLPISAVIKKLKEQYHVFVIWPLGGYDHARAQYVKLFGKECVATLQDAHLICELIGSLVGMNEKKLPKQKIIEDLVASGVGAHDARTVVQGLLTA
jgi:hypothetical protein